MIAFGNPPDRNEFEISFFGPGYGEAIAIHLGENIWYLIDSCVCPVSKLPATAAYLDSLGVPASSVQGIIATHWHDDHVRGLSELTQKYSDAEFFLSSVFNHVDAMAFLAAHCNKTTGAVSKGTNELLSILIAKRNASKQYTVLSNRGTVYAGYVAGSQIMFTALAPLAAAHSISIASLAQYLPQVNGSMGNAPSPLPPNLECVVLHLDLGEESILLGADLEEHPVAGWSALLKNPWVQRSRKSNIYKVAHHGSDTAHVIGIWDDLLEKKPISCVTPFRRGVNPLPDQNAISRLKSLSRDAYLSAPSKKKTSLNKKSLIKLKNICQNVSGQYSKYGVVRLRKIRGEADWRVECFGDAEKL